MKRNTLRLVLVGAALLVVSMGLLVVAKRGWLSRSRAQEPAAVSRAQPEPPKPYAKPVMVVEDLEPYGGDPAAEGEAPGEFRPRPDLPAWPLTLPIDWTADPFKDGSWRAQLHMLRMLNSILSRYEATGDSQLYRQAVAIVLDWWRFHQAGKRVPGSVWEGMRAGTRAVKLAYVLDRALSGREKLGFEQQTALFEMARVHVARLSDPKAQSDTNHAIFQLRGLALLCRVLGESSGCRGAEAFLAQRLRDLLEAQLTERGIHREHSPTYQLLAISAFEGFVKPGGTGVYKELADRVELARSSVRWFVFPGGRMAALGDSDGLGPTEPPADQRCGASSTKGCVEVGTFTRDGYAVVRSPWSEDQKRAFMLIMTGSHNSRAHKHADDLSFELMERGEMLFVDVGKYSYESDPMRRFAISLQAHNTVGLADEQIGPSGTKHHATALEPTEVVDGVYTLKGRIEYPGSFVHKRSVEYAPGRYLAITDVVRSTSARQYESYLHLAPHLTPRSVGSAFVVPLAGGRQMRIENLTPDCTASVVRGVRDKRQIQGWVTEKYRTMVPASVLTFACPGKSRRIELLVSFDAAARKAALARRAPEPQSD